MKPRTTLILFIVFAVLLAAVLFFESKGKKAQAAKEKEGLLIDVAAADITKIELKKEGADIVLSKDDKGDWRVAAPVETKADASEVDGLANGLAKVRIERTVEKDAKDLQAFGIPTDEVTLWVKGREAPVRLLVGAQNPLDNTLYAKREDDPRLVLISGYLKTNLDKGVFDFRQKDVFKFETAEVKAIRLKGKDVSWEAAREDGEWLFKAPVKALASQTKLNGLLDSLSGLRAKAFLSEDKKAEDIRKYGLDKPADEVVLSLPGANKDIVFRIAKSDDTFAAMTSESNKIVSFEGTLASDLERKVDDLREKKVADFYSWEADRVSVKNGPLDLAAVKEKVKDTDTWFLETAAKEVADGSKIEAFARKVEGLEATGFVDNPKSLATYGLEPPEAEVRIRTKGSDGKVKETVLFIGTEDKDKKQVTVKNARFDYLFVVDASFLQDLPKEAKDWTAPPRETEKNPVEKKRPAG